MNVVTRGLQGLRRGAIQAGRGYKVSSVNTSYNHVITRGLSQSQVGRRKDGTAAEPAVLQQTQDPHKNAPGPRPQRHRGWAPL